MFTAVKLTKSCYYPEKHAPCASDRRVRMQHCILTPKINHLGMFNVIFLTLNCYYIVKKYYYWHILYVEQKVTTFTFRLVVKVLDTVN